MTKEGISKAMVRFGAVSLVLAKVRGGMAFSKALVEVTKTPFADISGRILRFSPRTLRRWVAAYKKNGIDALEPVSRRDSRPSRVLSDDFLGFLVKQKIADPDASIPETIRRAAVCGAFSVPRSRSTVWRAARKLNLPIFATKGLAHTDMRRYQFQHRLQMVLADGKYFRAGIKSRRRVVITFLDDATRYALGAVVGTSESSYLFLLGLWKIMRRWGFFECFYLDHGSAFIAKTVATVIARSGAGLVHGRVKYPEGHGKIERYHQTLSNDLLRSFPRNPEIDADCQSLELRIEHYLSNDYNRRPHESLDGETPEARLLSDSMPLRPLDDFEKIRRHFVITILRRVSRDNVVKVGGVNYEMPRGYAGKVVEIHWHRLDDTVSTIDGGRLVKLSEVDPVANSSMHRGRTRPLPALQSIPSKTASTMLFEKDHQPLVEENFDCFE
jgi:putative transposase